MRVIVDSEGVLGLESTDYRVWVDDDGEAKAIIVPDEAMAERVRKILAEQGKRPVGNGCDHVRADLDAYLSWRSFCDEVKRAR